MFKLLRLWSLHYSQLSQVIEYDYFSFPEYIFLSSRIHNWLFMCLLAFIIFYMFITNSKKKWTVLIFKNFSNFHSLSSSLRLLSWRIPDSLLISLKPGIRASWVSSHCHPVCVIYLSPGFDCLVPDHFSFFFPLTSSSFYGVHFFQELPEYLKMSLFYSQSGRMVFQVQNCMEMIFP